MSATMLDTELEDVTRDAHAPELEWPYLRREILEGGGIGPSPDWPRDWYPGDLYREHGTAPDVVASETFLGRADVPPWGEGGDDAAMFAYLRRAWADWESAPASARFSLQETPERKAARERGKERRRMAASVAPAPVPAPVKRAPGTRSFADLVRDLRAKHGDAVDLAGLRPEYVGAYESGERVTVTRDGREYRGTIGATRGPRPRFVLLLSMDL